MVPSSAHASLNCDVLLVGGRALYGDAPQRGSKLVAEEAEFICPRHKRGGLHVPSAW